MTLETPVETSSTDSPFRYLMRVRYSECDAQQVVFNARYADYVDLAVTEFWRALGLSYTELLARELDNQLVSLALQWSSPARFDDVLAIAVETLRLGNTSFTLGFSFTDQQSGRAIAKAEAVYVLLDSRQWRKTPLPEDVRRLLLGGARGRTISHAGECR